MVLKHLIFYTVLKRSIFDKKERLLNLSYGLKELDFSFLWVAAYSSIYFKKPVFNSLLSTVPNT